MRCFITLWMGKLCEKTFCFSVDGKFGPDVTLNEYIRNEANLKGTKYMCNEGGCGVCVVSVQAALPPTQENKTFAVNSVSLYTSR